MRLLTSRLRQQLASTVMLSVVSIAFLANCLRSLNLDNALASDAPGIYSVLTGQTHELSATLPPTFVYRINTGGPLPAGADTVIMVEDTKLISTMKDDNGDDIEESAVEILAQSPPGENVRAPGSDVSRGDLVLQKGERIHSAGGEIGSLAFVGRKEVCMPNNNVTPLIFARLRSIKSP